MKRLFNYMILLTTLFSCADKKTPKPKDVKAASSVVFQCKCGQHIEFSHSFTDTFQIGCAKCGRTFTIDAATGSTNKSLIP